MEENLEIQIAELKLRIKPMERLVAVLADSLAKPLFYHSGQEHFGFRYAKPGVLHFCLLKAVRAVSALNAMIALARVGYVQEIWVLARTLVECTTHIEFVLDALKDGVLRSDADKYVKDYFADYARNSSADFKRAQVRQKNIHKRLGETLDNLVKQKGFDDSRGSTEELYSSVYMNYSNYVHAKYPEVMDLYGGKPEHFHLDGMLGTPKDEENIGAIDTYINGTGITLQLIISKLRLHYLLEADTALRIWFHST